MTAPAPWVADPGECCRGWCWLPRDVTTERHNLPWDPYAHGPDRPARHLVGRPFVHHNPDGSWQVTWTTPADAGYLTVTRGGGDHATTLAYALRIGHATVETLAPRTAAATPRVTYQAVRIPAEMATMEDL